MKDPQEDKPSALLRLAMRLYNSGYEEGCNDTIESQHFWIDECDMEKHHEEEVDEILQNFLKSGLTPQDFEQIYAFFDNASLPKTIKKK